MKTKTNFQKAALRCTAMVISIVLIAITVSAQGFWKKLITNSSFNIIAGALAEPVNNANIVESDENKDHIQYNMAYFPVFNTQQFLSENSPIDLMCQNNRKQIYLLTEELSLFNQDTKSGLVGINNFEIGKVHAGI